MGPADIYIYIYICIYSAGHNDYIHILLFQQLFIELHTNLAPRKKNLLMCNRPAIASHGQPSRFKPYLDLQQSVCALATRFLHGKSLSLGIPLLRRSSRFWHLTFLARQLQEPSKEGENRYSRGQVGNRCRQRPANEHVRSYHTAPFVIEPQEGKYYANVY